MAADDFSDYVTVSEVYPPDRFSQRYPVCDGCGRRFYTQFNFSRCSDCSRKLELQLKQHYDRIGRPQSHDLE